MSSGHANQCKDGRSTARGTRAGHSLTKKNQRPQTILSRSAVLLSFQGLQLDKYFCCVLFVFGLQDLIRMKKQTKFFVCVAIRFFAIFPV